jgi:hypothetical protein
MPRMAAPQSKEELNLSRSFIAILIFCVQWQLTTERDRTRNKPLKVFNPFFLAKDHHEVGPSRYDSQGIQHSIIKGLSPINTVLLLRRPRESHRRRPISYWSPDVYRTFTRLNVPCGTESAAWGCTSTDLQLGVPLPPQFI